MDATAAAALSIAIDRAVPPALEVEMENKRLRAELHLSNQKYLAFVKAECDKCNTIIRLIRETLDRMMPGADTNTRQVLWDLIFGILAAVPPLEF